MIVRATTTGPGASRGARDRVLRGFIRASPENYALLWVRHAGLDGVRVLRLCLGVAACADGSSGECRDGLEAWSATRPNLGASGAGFPRLGSNLRFRRRSEQLRRGRRCPKSATTMGWTTPRATISTASRGAILVQSGSLESRLGHFRPRTRPHARGHKKTLPEQGFLEVPRTGFEPVLPP